MTKRRKKKLKPFLTEEMKVELVKANWVASESGVWWKDPRVKNANYSDRGAWAIYQRRKRAEVEAD